MMTIPLTQGKVALVDDEDYEKLAVHKWHAAFRDGTWYATRRTPQPHNTLVYMHRVIMSHITSRVDHKDNNGLNNQRYNLRPCTSSQNARNARHHRQSSSIYKGVSFKKSSGKWRANIYYDRKHHHLGTFTSEFDAHLAYRREAEIHFGDFANFKGAREDDN